MSHGKKIFKRSKMLVAALFLPAAGLLLCLWLYRSYMNSPEPALSGEMLVEIETGMSLRQAAQRLWERGVISRPRWFVLAGRLQKVSTRIQAGDYTFRPGMSPLQVLDMITRGDITTVKLVVPEGFNIFEIGYRLERLGPWSRTAFLSVAQSPEKAQSLGIPVASLEGWLCPAVYDLKMSMKEEQIIDLMLRRGEREQTASRLERAAARGLGWHQVLTLASLIEKETAAIEEMPIIASVFENRLQKNMFLQSDPTAVYGVKDLGEGVTSQDLERAGPYNTYLNRGLPPGPICNPGPRAIEAALNPADTDYLYFVATGDGGHLFARTYNEHRKHINSYRRKLKQAQAQDEQTLAPQ